MAYLTVKEAAQRSGYTVSGIRRLIKGGKLTGYIKAEDPYGQTYFLIPEQAIDRLEKPKSGRPRKSGGLG